MTNYYCEYCGTKFSSVSGLTSNLCLRYPSGSSKGKHKLYEGREKSLYDCKYCGVKYSNLSSLTSNLCLRHPNGSSKGRHAPAL
jgi:DNA-directed RNA polymerase subunit RPC12/RpoP